MQAPYVAEKPSLLNLPLELSIMISELLVERTQQDLLSDYRDVLGDLLSLSLTCKALAHSCAPTLYKRVVLSDATNTLRFLKGILRRPFLKDCVRILVTTDPAPPSERKKSKRSTESDEVTRKETKETTKVVKSDGVAAELLWSGAVRLDFLVLVRLLQQLPKLRQLSTIRTISQLEHWPEKERLIGPSITKLHLFAAIDGDGNGDEEVNSWMRAFQPGRGPTALDSFRLDCHNLRPSRSSSPSRPLDGSLREYTASLQDLSLENVTRDILHTFSSLFKHYPRLITVRILSDRVRLDDALAALVSSPDLTSHLRVLEIVGTAGECEHRLEAFKHLPSFAKLTTLGIPMAHAATLAMHLSDHISPGHSTMTWPPHLETLALSQMDWFRYLNSTARLIEAGSMPTSLRSITITWYSYCFPSMLERDLGFECLVSAVERFERACNSKNIAVRHFSDDPPPNTINEKEQRHTLAELKRVSVKRR